MGNGQVNKEELNKKAERVVSGDRQPAPAPGKSTLKIDDDPTKSLHPTTGNEYIDKEGVTSDSDLLTSKQRDLLVNNFQQRVLEASSTYKAALMQVRMDKLFEKPEDMSWILTLALGAIGWYGGIILSKVASDMLKEGGDARVATAQQPRPAVAPGE